MARAGHSVSIPSLQAFRREVLFAFEPALPGVEPTFEESGKATRSPNLVLINVSPIEYGHVLLCPRVLDCLPQNIDPSTTRLALHFALEVGNPYLRVGFNSLGAFATINHLHFQVRGLWVWGWCRGGLRHGVRGVCIHG